MEQMTPRKIRQAYTNGTVDFTEEQITEAMRDQLSFNALEWIKKGGSPENIFKMVWPLVEECGIPYFISQHECRKIISDEILNYKKSFSQTYMNNKADKFDPTNISAELDEMERMMSVSGQQFHFGIDEFDSAIGGGIRKGEMMSILGSPGCMKTSLLINGIQRWTSESNDPVVFFSADMDKTDIFKRFMLREIGCGERILEELVHTNDIRYTQAKNSFAKRLMNKLTVIGNTTTDKITIDTIEEYVAERMPGLVCIDYLTKIKKPMQDDYKAANEIAPKLADIAHTYNCAIVVLSQMSMASRNAQASGGIGGTSAKGGPVVEENSDIEIELMRDVSSSPETGVSVPNIVATIKKTRKGMAGASYLLDADFPQMRFKSTCAKAVRNKKINSMFSQGGSNGWLTE